MLTVFEVRPDPGYDFLRIAPHDWEEWHSQIIALEQAIRGIPLKSRWNEQWNFVVNEEEWEHAEHPKGLGDFAHLLTFIAATNEKAFELLSSLLGEAAEVLNGNFEGRSIWFFNVIRQVNRRDVAELEDGAVFRINPLRLRTLCGRAFKEVLESSGLKGLAFRKVDPNDRYGLV